MLCQLECRFYKLVVWRCNRPTIWLWVCYKVFVVLFIYNKVNLILDVYCVAVIIYAHTDPCCYVSRCLIEDGVCYKQIILLTIINQNFPILILKPSWKTSWTISTPSFFPTLELKYKYIIYSVIFPAKCP